MKKNKVFLFLLTICLGLLLIGQTSINKASESVDTILDEIIERDGEYDNHKLVLNDTSKEEAKSLSERLNAKLRINKSGNFATLTLPDDVTVYDICMDEDNEDIIDKFSLDYQAEISEMREHYPSKPKNTVNDPYYSMQTYLEYLNLDKVWNTTKGSGVTVAIIDTGIDTDHIEFSGRISEYSYNATEDKIVKDYLLEDGSYDWSLIEDEQGHGTSVAGVVGASMNNNTGICGIASSAELLIIKAECDESGSFYSTSDLVFGLYYAIEQDADVVNMSFGSNDSEAFTKPARLAKESDVICVAAAGNDGMPVIRYPAADENVIAVGALASDSWELASYSNYGDELDCVAPGTVYTTKMGGTYGTIDGTSFSSPIVASIIALYLSKNKYQELSTIKELLYASCKDLGDLGPDFYYGYGAVDASALILENKGTVTFNYSTSEIDDTYQTFVRQHTLQQLPEPERLYAIFDGWYYDIHCTEPLIEYEDVFSKDLTLYAKWVNEDDGVPYTYQVLEDNTIEITGYKGRRKYITIPDIIDGMEVSSIGRGAFQNETSLRIVTLPSTLKVIKDNAFSNCINLTRAEIPDGVTSIGEKAFNNCTRLVKVSFGENSKLTSIGNYAFLNNVRLVTINLPKNLKSFNGSCLLGTLKLKEINVSNNNKYFRSIDGVLYNSTINTIVAYPSNKGTSYSINNKTTEIGVYAFGYSKIKTINLNNVQTINDGAFIYSSLENIDLSNVTNTGEGVFLSSVNLKSVTIGNKLTSISGGMFYNCSSVENIFIPKNIVNIHYSLAYGGAFSFCRSLTNVTFEENSNLTQICAEAFFSTSIREITIPKSVINIGNKVFVGCYNLINVTFEEGSNLSYIGEAAFGYTSISNINLPSKLIYIGSYAFKNTSLQSVLIPSSVLSIGSGVFASCNSLTSIEVDSLNKNYVSVDGVLYSKDLTSLIMYPSGKTNTSYTINANTTSITNSSFYGVCVLKNVTLNTKLIKIDNKAFFNATSITNVNLNANLEEIGDEAFEYATSLRNIKITDNVTKIGRFSFAFTNSLTNITFNSTSKLPRISYGAFAYSNISSFNVPSNVSTISQGAFLGCSNLTSITFNTNSKLTSISAYMFDGCSNLTTIKFENGSKLSSIQAHGLEGMSNLTSIDFGDATITNIDNFAFRFCSSLTTLNLTEGLTYIGRFAFYGCEKLQSLQMPSTLEYIGRYAFYECNDLELYFESNILPIYTQDYWDHSIKGYYLGVKDVKQNDEFKYAILQNNNIAIIEYLGTSTIIDLTDIDFGGDIITIGSNSFKYKEITKVVLPNTVKTIGSNAFYCSTLSNINFVDSITYIGSNAFFNTKLENVIFSNNSNLTKIDNNAFAYCKNLCNVTLPSTLSSLGEYSFYKSGVINLNLNSEMPLESISKYAFEYTHINKLTLPNNVKEIKDNAFSNISELETVEFNNQELYLMANAFYNSGLKELTIPENITYIGEYSLISLYNLTEYKVNENNPYYKSIDGVLYSKDGKKVIAYPAGRKAVYKLPNEVESIGFGAFENSKLTYIDFTENNLLSTIGYRAFFKCNNLESITIPSNVVSIDYYSFAYCNNLKEVLFEENSKLYGIYEGAFYSCKNLNSIIVPDEVVELGDFSFYGCLSLTKIPVSSASKLLSISSRALSNTGIKEITLPDELIKIGDYAFSASKVEKVNLNNSKKEELYLGIGIFEDCVKLKEITLPFIGRYYEDEEVTWFGYIFGAGNYQANNTYVPESLKEVTIEEGITFIGTGGFYGLTNIKRVNIPDSINIVYLYSFSESTFKYKLTNEIIFMYKDRYGEDVISDYLDRFYIGKGIEEIIIPNSVTSIGDFAFYGCSNLSSIEIPNSVTSIGDAVFSGCSSLTSIEIPNSVISIGGSAFWCCSSLTSIYLPDSVTSIGNVAFENCTSLTSISIPNSVTSIGTAAFENCSSLTSIEIPNSVISIEWYAFSGCSSLENVYYGGTIEDWCNISFDYYYYSNPMKYASHFYLKNSNEKYEEVTEIEIPDTITKIEANKFRNFLNLKTIIITNSVTSIEENVFTDCINLENIYYNGTIKDWCNISFESLSSNPMSYANHFYIKNSNGEYEEVKEIEISNIINSISVYRFYNFSVLEKVTIPNSVTSIGSYAFSGCLRLTSIEIPNSVTSIGYEAFKNCDNLENVYYDGTIEDWCNIIFNYYDTNPMSYANHFYIKNSNGEYEEVTEIEIPDTITKIGNYQFYGFNNVTKITIPNSVTSIGEDAFRNCISLVTIINNSDLELTIGSYDDNGGIAFYAYKIINKDGSITYKDEDKYTYIETEDNFLFRYDSNNNYQLVAYLGTKDLVTFPEDINGNSYDIYKMKGVRNVIIPDTFTSIGEYAFSDCRSLISIEIPNSVTSIWGYAFYDCINFENVYYGGTIEDWCNITFNNYYSNPMYYANHFYIKNSNGEHEEVTEIEIPNTITKIGNYQFEGFNNVTKITIPNSVISIGKETFYNCNSLENVYYDGTIEDWCNITFNSYFSNPMYYANHFYIKNSSGQYQEVTEIEIPDTISKIGDYQFVGFNNVTTITISNNVTSISSVSFYKYSGKISFLNNSKFIYFDNVLYNDNNILFIDNIDTITNIEILNGITSINRYIFGNCVNLKNIIIPKSVITIESNAFESCSSLENVYYNGTIEDWCNITLYSEYSNPMYYANHFFIKNSNGEYEEVIEIDIPSTITQISYSRFYNFTAMNKITISSSVTSIGLNAFTNCTNLEKAYYEGTIEDWCNITFSGWSSNPMYYAKHFYIKNSNGEYEEVTKIEIPDTITEIGYQFYGFNNVTKITIPNSVTTIGSNAFYNCNSLTSIEIPNSVTSIEYATFKDCSSLTSIEIPNSITSIGSDVFSGCYSLENVYYNGTIEDWCNITFNGWYSNPMEYAQHFYIKNSNGEYEEVTEIEIPDTITKIGNYQFKGFNNVTKIIIPNSVTTIGSNAFYGCSSLTAVINNSDLELIIGSSSNGYIACYAYKIVKNDGNIIYKRDDEYLYIVTEDNFLFRYDLDNNYQLVAYLGTEDTVTLPKDINGNSYKIYKMKGVKNVVIPDTFTSIGDFAFWDCTSLTSIEIPNSVTSIEAYAFAYCSSLTSIELPNSVTSIGSNAFVYCSSLTSIELPNSVTSIGSSAFLGCSSLTSITIPNSVTSIGWSAFRDCTSLSDITLFDSITYIGSNAFVNTMYYNNSSNWINGCLYIDNCLIEVKGQCKYLTIPDNVAYITDYVLTDTKYTLKQINLKSNKSFLSGTTNIETIIIDEIPDYNFSSWVNILDYYGLSNTLTLKNIILGPNAKLNNQNHSLFNDVTGINIYVSTNKTDTPWDENFPNWNNNNNVYYGDEWIKTEYYDNNGYIVSSEIYLTSQVIRVPIINIPSDDEYDYEIIGWDIDGDGIADSILATSSSDIIAKPIIKKTERLYTIRFMDNDKVLYTYNLPYNSVITKPDNPSKKGYTFNGWNDFIEGMMVTTNIDFLANFTHDGDGHDYSMQVVVNPTCTTDGYTKHICSICDEYYTTDIVKATGHNYNESIINPTCSSEGCIKHECSICGDIYYDNYISKLNHNYGEWIIDNEETCTATGLKHHVCEECDFIEYEDIPTHDHTFTTTVVKESTCSEEGTIKHTCSECNLEIEESISKKEHDYEKTYISDSFLEWLIKMILNILFGYEGEQAYYYQCSECHKIKTIEEETSNIVSSMSVQSSKCNHILGEWYEGKAASCVDSGIEYRDCEICNKHIEFRTGTNALGHDLVHHEALDPTCTASGHNAYDTCTRCSYTTYEEIAALGHDIEHHEALTPTCTEPGHYAYDTCIRCDYTNYQEIASLGHDIEHHNALDPTCTTSGHYAYDTCTRCDYTTFEEITALGHDIEHHEALTPTCTEPGHNAYDTCTRCDYTTYEEITALGHDIEHHEALDPTCTELGHNAYDSCTRCSYTTFEEIDPLGHTYSTTWSYNTNSHYHECSCGDKNDIGSHSFIWVIDIDATEEETGLKHQECEICKYETNYNTSIPKLDHTHNIIHVERQEETCTEDGYKEYYYCIKCNKYYTNSSLTIETTYDNLVIKAKHNLVHHDSLDPTCTVSGHNAYDTCTRCSYTTYQEIKALGHNNSDWIIDKEATCTENGSKHIECTRCGITLQTSSISKLDHDLVHHEALDPTCTKSGHSAYDTCTRCDYTTYQEIKALGHNNSSWIIDKEATCTENGSKHIECTRCGITLQTSVISKLDHDLVHHDALDPTCTKSGHNAYDICTRCDYTTYQEIKALGHNNSSWIIDKEATCTKTGSKHIECTRCGTTLQTSSISKLDHDLVHHDALDPTCTASGHNAYDTCKNCSYTTFQEIPALGHSYSTTWSYGKNTHYHECSCGSKNNVAYHSFTWVVDKEATEYETGLKHEECTVCKYKRNENTIIDKLDHTHNINHIKYKEHTCTEDGHKEYYYCTICKKYYLDSLLKQETTLDNIIIKAGHDLVHHEALSPTCTSSGHNAYDSCKNCSYSTFQEIKALGHNNSSWITDKEATCTETGSKHIECTRCKEVLQTESISPKGHNSSDWIIDKEATSSENGTKHKECTVCGDILETEEIKKQSSSKCSFASTITQLFSIISFSSLIFLFRKKKN